MEMLMKAIVIKKSTNLVAAQTTKRLYKRPNLKDFGKLHMATQSTGMANGDGGQNMKP
jgi:hypothetical protein